MNLLLAFLTLPIAVLLTWWFCSPAASLKILDHPAERSRHGRSVPRTGGLTIYGGIFYGFLLCRFFLGWEPRLTAIGVGATLIAGISFLDDCFELPILFRLLWHFGAAAFLLVAGLGLKNIELLGNLFHLPEEISIGISVLFIVWMVNLFNFMDGIDGLAGGMAVFGFGTFAVLGWLAGHELFLTLNIVAALAAGGFLFFNFPPARIFMGDTGATFLGFMAAAFSLWGIQDGLLPIWGAILIFSPFIVDATVTMILRILRYEKVWLAHESHFYQRLIQLQWSHKKTVLWEYLIMLACAVSTVWAIDKPFLSQGLILTFWTIVYILLVFRIKSSCNRESASIGRKTAN